MGNPMKRNTSFGGSRHGLALSICSLAMLLVGSFGLAAESPDALVQLAKEITSVRLVQRVKYGVPYGVNEIIDLELVAYNKKGVIPLTTEQANALFTWKVENDVAKPEFPTILPFENDPHRQFVQIVTAANPGNGRVIVQFKDRFHKSQFYKASYIIRTQTFSVNTGATAAGIAGLAAAPIQSGPSAPMPKPPPAQPLDGGATQSLAGRGTGISGGHSGDTPLKLQGSWDGGRGSTLGNGFSAQAQPPATPPGHGLNNAAQQPGEAMASSGNRPQAPAQPSDTATQPDNGANAGGMPAQPASPASPNQIGPNVYSATPANPAVPSPASPNQVGPGIYTAEPMQGGQTGTDAPNTIDGAQGQALTGQGLTAGTPDTLSNPVFRNPPRNQNTARVETAQPSSTGGGGAALVGVTLGALAVGTAVWVVAANAANANAAGGGCKAGSSSCPGRGTCCPDDTPYLCPDGYCHSWVQNGYGLRAPCNNYTYCHP